MARTWIRNQDCYHPWGLHGRLDRCDTYMEQGRDGTWYAMCASWACATDGGSPGWRAGSRSGVFSYEDLYDMAVQHCLKHHGKQPPNSPR